MKILLLGATGNIGSRILSEAVSRDHDVTAAARHTDDVPADDHVEVAQLDASDADAVARLAAGHDAIVASLSPRGEGGVETYLEAIRATLDAVRRSDAERALIVGGAGSLEIEPGLELLDTPEFPEEFKSEAEAGREARDLARQSDVNWTVFSPAIVIEPGERTGQFRTAGNQLLTDDEGQSQISTEDFAVALIDELEEPQYERDQFTAAY